MPYVVCRTSLLRVIARRRTLLMGIRQHYHHDIALNHRLPKSEAEFTLFFISIFTPPPAILSLISVQSTYRPGPSFRISRCHSAGTEKARREHRVHEEDPLCLMRNSKYVRALTSLTRLETLGVEIHIPSEAEVQGPRALNTGQSGTPPLSTWTRERVTHAFLSI